MLSEGEKRRRLARDPGKAEGEVEAVTRELSDEQRELRRPRYFWINLLLTLASMAMMISGLVPPAVMFMAATALSLLLNYPDLAEQRRRVDAHARAALMMASILLAAGVLIGIMQGSGMLTAMARTAADHVPAGLARHVPVVLGLISMPLSLPLRPRLVLPRRAAGRRRGRRDAGRRARPRGTGRAARPDDDGLPGEPAHAVDLPAGGTCGRRARRPPAVLVRSSGERLS